MTTNEAINVTPEAWTRSRDWARANMQIVWEWICDVQPAGVYFRVSDLVPRYMAYFGTNSDRTARDRIRYTLKIVAAEGNGAAQRFGNSWKI